MLWLCNGLAGMFYDKLIQGLATARFMPMIKWGYDNENEVMLSRRTQTGSMKLGLNEIGSDYNIEEGRG